MGNENGKPVSLCFRGLGNLASKVIYLSAEPKNGQPSANRRFFFKYGIIKPDELTRTNLAHLAERGFFAADIKFFVVGTAEDERIVRGILGPNAEVFNEQDFMANPSAFSVDVTMDFTFDANPFVQALRNAGIDTPVVVQSNSYSRGVLWVPPLRERETSKNSTRVFRAADCTLSGTIPVLSRLQGVFQKLFISFMTDRNAGRGAGSSFDNIFYFSDSLPRRRSQEFTALTGVNTIVTLVSSSVVNPFYLATIMGVVDEVAVPATFGSWTRFEKTGFTLSLADVRCVEIYRKDNTSEHVLPPEPENIREFSLRYPDAGSKPYIIYFTRTFIRRGNQVSFNIGFDVNLSAAISNIDLIDAIMS